jgi:hypothetical protein
MTLREASALVGVSMATLRRRVQSGELTTAPRADSNAPYLVSASDLVAAGFQVPTQAEAESDLRRQLEAEQARATQAEQRAEVLEVRAVQAEQALTRLEGRLEQAREDLQALTTALAPALAGIAQAQAAAELRATQAEKARPIISVSETTQTDKTAQGKPGVFARLFGRS